jgi:hypothetical protein
MLCDMYYSYQIKGALLFSILFTPSLGVCQSSLKYNSPVSLSDLFQFYKAEMAITESSN